MFSFGIFVRTADPHLIYDSTTKGRINPSASVFIGDHVWVGQDVLILKGTRIGSGSIVGGATCIAGKMIPSNVTIGGNPARIIRENVFFLPNCVHSWTDDVIEEYSIKLYNQPTTTFTPLETVQTGACTYKIFVYKSADISYNESAML